MKVTFLCRGLRGNFLLLLVLIGLLKASTLCSQTGPFSTNCVPAPSGLVGWWRGESSPTDEVTGMTGQLIGGASFVNGQVGTAFNFDGDGDGLVLTNAKPFKLQSFSIEAWIRRADTTRSSAVPGGGLVFGFGTGGYVLGLLDNGQIFLSAVEVSDVRTTLSVTDTNWHHVAVVFATNEATFYLDGVSSGPMSYPATFTFNTPAAIGIRSNNPNINSFLGAIDELSVYSRPLDASEIQAIYNAGSSGKCSSLPTILTQPKDRTVQIGSGVIFQVEAAGASPLSYQWRFDGTSIFSATSASLTLTNVQLADAGSYSVEVSSAAGSIVSSNAILTVVSSNCVPAPSGLVGWWRGESSPTDEVTGMTGQLIGGASFVNGQVGTAFNFDGDGDGLVLTNAEPFKLQSFSVEAWIRRADTTRSSAVPGGGLVFGFGAGGYALGLLDNGQIFLTAVQVSDVRTTLSVTDTNWHHVAVVFATNEATFYLDGVSSGPMSYPATFTFNTPAAIGIRSNNPNINSFLGAIDELSVYGRPLDASEFQAIYLSASAGRCPLPPFRIRLQPQGATLRAGTNVTFTVDAIGVGELTYQWTFNATNILADATNAFLTLTNIQLTQSGQYAVTVADSSSGSLASTPATLNVFEPPVIVVQPTGQTVVVGDSVRFSVSATNYGGALTYQWRRNGFVVAGGTAPILVIGAVQFGQAGSYTVTVSDGRTSVVSQPAVLTVVAAKITSGVVSSNGFTISVHSQPGVTFRVESTTSLNPSSWQQLASFLNVPVDWSFTDTSSAGEQTRFYRLRRVP